MTEEEKTDVATVLAAASGALRAGRTDGETDRYGERNGVWISRLHWHELFDETFQRELASLYRVSERGQPPLAQARLARASLVQASTGASDDETIEAIPMDRRVIRSLTRAVAGILRYLTGALDMLRVGTGTPCRRTPDGEILFSAGLIQTIRVRMFCHCKTRSSLPASQQKRGQEGGATSQDWRRYQFPGSGFQPV